MSTIPLASVLLYIAQDIPSIAVSAVASGISFRLYRQKQSRGFYLIFLGIFIPLIAGTGWSLLYWLVLFPTALNQSGALGISYFFTLIGWVSIAVSIGLQVLTFSLVIYGALQILQERSSMTLQAPPKSGG